MLDPHNDSVSAVRPRVLLVEDDDGVRRALHLILHGRGYDVRSFAAGATLLADPTLNEAHALIADYRLSEGDGITVRRALERLGWRGRSVLITAYSTHSLIASAREAGFDRVLEKPVRAHELIAAIEGRASVSGA